MIRIPDSKKKRMKIILHECASSSTSFPNITRTKKSCIKAMWLSFYFFCLIVCGIMMTDGVYEYLNYDVVTEIEVVYEMPTQFPTVTFFNLKNPKANYSLENILISCYFNDDKCSANDFDYKIDSLGYVSYSFNKKKLKQSTTAGKINGLQAELFTGLFDDMDISDETIARYFRSDGFQIIVHNYSMDPRYYAGIPFDGVEISPGFSTNLIVNRIFTYKLEEPHNDCKKNLDKIDSFDSHIYRLMINTRNYSYRQKDCFDYCVSNEFINQCNISVKLDNYCILLDENWDVFENNTKVLNCLEIVYQTLVGGKINEVCAPLCPLECDSISYEISTSFSKFPKQQYAYELKNNSIINSKYSNLNLSIDDIQKNVIAFNVYYKDLKYTKITQTAKMNIEDLISHLGGLLGLFIGVSFLSVAEIIEMLCNILSILFDSRDIIYRV